MGNNKFQLQSEYSPLGDQPQAIEKLREGVNRGDDFQTLLGVTGSGKTFTMANVIAEYNKPVLVIAPNKSLAAQLYQEYKKFFPYNSVNYFVSYYDYYQPEAYLPITDTYIEKEAMINEEIDRFRHQATSALVSRNDVIVVASVSCIYNLGVPSNYWQSSIHLELGQVITRADFITQLVKIQFERSKGVLNRGQFRVRGEMFELMPASQEIIYRIELQDQKIQALYTIDPTTRKIKHNLSELLVFPPQHFVSTQPEIEKALENIKAELEARLKYFKDNNLPLEAERLERRTKYDMEMLRSLGFCHGIENYSRHLTGKLPGETPDSLLSYFPWKNGKPDFLTIIDESHISIPQIAGMYYGDKSRKQSLVKYGWRLPSALDNRPLKFQEFMNNIGQTIFTSATPANWEKKKSTQIAEQIIRPTGLIDPPIETRPVFNQEENYSQIDDVQEEIREQVKNNHRVLVITLTKKQAEDLNSYLKDKGFKCNYLHSEIKLVQRTKILTDFRKGKFEILIGVNLLREGLDLPEVGLVAILDADREGFLRSRISLIQTMGRAARNVEGKVIFYADKVSGAMKQAIDEVERRRKKQKEYNNKHNITPKSINKKVEDLLDFSQFKNSDKNNKK